MKAINRLLAAFIILCFTVLVGAAEPSSSGAMPASGTSGCGKALAMNLEAGKTTTRTIASGESKRTYLVHVPANYDPKTPALENNFRWRVVNGQSSRDYL